MARTTKATATTATAAPVAAPAKASRTATGHGRVAKAASVAGMGTTAVTAMRGLQLPAAIAYNAALANPNARQQRHLARWQAHAKAQGIALPTTAQAKALLAVMLQPGGWAALAGMAGYAALPTAPAPTAPTAQG